MSFNPILALLPLSPVLHGEGNGNPLQCSCLENPRDGGAWWAAVYGVAQSRTRLKRLSSSSSLCCNFYLFHITSLPQQQPASFITSEISASHISLSHHSLVFVLWYMLTDTPIPLMSSQFHYSSLHFFLAQVRFLWLKP